MKKIIFHADDFGISSGINRGIIHCHQRGVLNSTSIMANGGAFENAVELYKLNPSLDIGIHLNITCGAPVCPTNSNPLVAKDNSFNSLSKQIWLLFSPTFPKEIIKNEYRCQIQKVIDNGIIPSHIDTHHHLHFSPRIKEIVVELANEFKIPWIRESKHNLFLTALKAPFTYKNLSGLKSLIKIFLLSVLQSSYGMSQHAFSDYIIGLNTIHKTQYLTYLKFCISNLTNGITEIVCHPGYITHDLFEYDSWADMREEELEALTSPEIKQLLEEKQIKLHSYKEEA